MPFLDFVYVFRFWAVYFILGIIAFPLTSKIFSRFLDRGYIFSKTLGLLLVSFFMWYAASFKILPFNLNSLLIITSLIALISLISQINLFSDRETRELRASLQKKTKGGFLAIEQLNNRTIALIVFEELLFFACLLLWSYIRGFQPIIEGLEKYMDFGFINAILRSPYMPPHDMWLSGHTINYYYFGHFQAAVMTRLSQIPPEVIYNLMIAVIFAFCFVSSFSIGLNLFYHLKRSLTPLKSPNSPISLVSLLFPALLTAYLVANAANLQPVYHLLTKGSSSYWYPDATRFIVKKFGGADETIHEFPHYSFVVADLHGHVSDIPTVLALIAFIFILFLKINAKRHPEAELAETEGSRQKKSAPWARFPFSVFDSLLLGFLLSVSYMTNAMDGPVYFGLAGLTVFGGLIVGARFSRPLGGSPRVEAGETPPLQIIIVQTFLFFLFTGLAFIICSFPFLKSFKNFTGGVTPVDFRSPLWMLNVLWGFQFFMGASFVIFIFGRQIFRRENVARAVANFFGVKIKIIKSRLPLSPSLHLFPSDIFILFLLFLSFLLIIFPEFFYIKDIYIHEYQRANTMFKMTYQSFIMLYICAGYIFFRILHYVKNNPAVQSMFPTVVFLLLSIAGLVSVGIYPYFATKSYYGLTKYQGLDGLKYLQALYPDDYKLITSLNSSSPPIPSNPPFTLLEAVGDSYTKYARISANTGISTALGWPVHEWLWRNGYDIPGRRTADVQKIYESADLNETIKLLKTYKVDYVWIGQLEKEKYKNLDEKKFKKVGKIFLKFGNSILYKIN